MTKIVIAVRPLSGYLMTITCAFYNESSAFSDDNGSDHWLRAFAQQFPHLNVTHWQAIEDPESVIYGIVWQPDEAFFQRFPNLTSLFNLGAGVDGILNNPCLPPTIDIYRIEGAGMAEQMNEYFAYHVLHFHRLMHVYQQQQTHKQWASYGTKLAKDYHVGILGLGVLGNSAAHYIKQLGYRVSGWSRQQKQLDGIDCYAGTEALSHFLGNLDVVCCLLPLTPATRNILNDKTLRQLPQGAVVINAARGEHVVEEDLLALLNAGHLQGAVLDTVRQEPLPKDNPLWCHPKVIITPHCAAQSWVEPCVARIGDNITALIKGQPASGLVNQNAGY